MQFSSEVDYLVSLVLETPLDQVLTFRDIGVERVVSMVELNFVTEVNELFECHFLLLLVLLDEPIVTQLQGALDLVEKEVETRAKEEHLLRNTTKSKAEVNLLTT